MCQECQRPALGSLYCDAHAPAATLDPSPVPATIPVPYSSDPYTAPAAAPHSASAPPDESVHPVLALLLGLIPGVGAIYNGQYAKGLVHAVVFGLLVSTVANPHNGGMAALVGIMIGAWVFYMAFEAYHTARKRRYGVAVEEFSSLIDVRSTQGGRFPAGAVVLIALGVILLLDTTGIIAMDEMERYWPVGLIVFGVYLLFVRMNAASRHSGDNAGDGTEVRR
jgi:hypothetical protein